MRDAVHPVSPFDLDSPQDDPFRPRTAEDLPYTVVLDVFWHDEDTDSGVRIAYVGHVWDRRWTDAYLRLAQALYLAHEAPFLPSRIEDAAAFPGHVLPCQAAHSHAEDGYYTLRSLEELRATRLHADAVQMLFDDPLAVDDQDDLNDEGGITD